MDNRTDALAQLRDRHLAFVRRTILGSQCPTYGRQVRYLMECSGVNIRSGNVSVAGPSTFDLATFRRLGSSSRYGQGTEDGGNWWDNVLGPTFSMVGPARLKNIEDALVTCFDERIPGDFFEAGVWRGGASMYAKAVLDAYGEEGRSVWLADSFKGLPAPDAERGDPTNLNSNWVLSVSRSDVESGFENLGLLDDSIFFVEGYFEETLKACPVERIATLRLDGDYYSSTYASLEALYPKVSPGGFIIIDDFGCYLACRSAVYDYLGTVGHNPHILPIDWTGVYWRKPVE